MNNPYSSLKIFHHNDALMAIERKEQRAPFYIRLKPTNICNQHCVYCTYGSGNTQQKTQNRNDIDHGDSIPWPKMQEIIADMGAMGVKAVTFSGGGEPLTYPHIVEAANLLQSYGIGLSLISNGQLLVGNVAQAFYMAKWVRISFDSPDETLYCQTRGVSPTAFRKVCDNIRAFAVHKDKDCVLGVNFVISRDNADYVYQAAEFLKGLGVNNVKFAAMIANAQGYHVDIKDKVIQQIHRAQAEVASDSFQIINNYENDWMDKNFTEQSFPVCYTCKLVTVIAADQKVYFCHTRAYDSDAVVGDLRNQSFRELWFSDETGKRLDDLRPKQDCRNFCVYEERNRLIQAYFDVDMRHVNFI